MNKPVTAQDVLALIEECKKTNPTASALIYIIKAEKAMKKYLEALRNGT